MGESAMRLTRSVLLCFRNGRVVFVEDDDGDAVHDGGVGGQRRREGGPGRIFNGDFKVFSKSCIIQGETSRNISILYAVAVGDTAY